jgi:methylisocitrate lyase
MVEKTAAGERLRSAVAENNPLQVVGTVTAYAAIIAEKVGHKALYLSGGGVSASSLGVPDLGITALADVLEDVRRITAVTSAPLLVDVDTGFGGPLNVARTTREVCRAGAAGLHIEDQVPQKRCGHRPNKAVVEQREMVERIEAAVEARPDESFVIMARTDALAVLGMEAAIERAQACVEAGADMVFPEAMQTLEQYQRFSEAVDVPVLANLTEFGQTPLFTTAELAGVGCSTR